MHTGRFPLTCGGFIFSHIHIGLILCLSHASAKPWRPSPLRPSSLFGNLRCQHTQKGQWKLSNSSRAHYLQYQKKIALLPNTNPTLKITHLSSSTASPFYPFPVRFFDSVLKPLLLLHFLSIMSFTLFQLHPHHHNKVNCRFCNQQV